MKINAVLTKLDNYSVRIEEIDGRQHLVAPVVILTEGVHCGSAGCKYYPAEELAYLPGAWNGRPIPVLHPEDEYGNGLSANSPEIIQKQSVGQLFNMIFEDNKLKGEVWIEISKAQEISPGTLATIQARKPLEVSTGLWSDDEFISGEWNGEQYDSIVRHIVPDHLALLPGGEGACSVEDGCGLRANKNKGGEMKKFLSSIQKVFQDTELEPLTEKSVNSVIEHIRNELSHNDIRRNLQREIDKLDNPIKIHYVVEVFKKYFIYQAQSQAEGGVSKLYKQSYSVKTNDEIELGEEVSEVQEVVSFENLKVKEVKDNMAKKICCPEKVQALIDNEKSVYTNEHKELLLTLSEEELEKLQPTEVIDNSEELENLKKENETLKANQKEKEDEANKAPKEVKFEDLLANAPVNVKESIEHGMTMFNDQKAEIVAVILKNENCDYTEDELKGMDYPGLKKLSKAFKVSDYSANLAPDMETSAGEEPLVINRGGDGKK